MDKVEKIRNEIERLHGNPYYMMAIKDVLSIIDSPQEENSFDAHIQEGDKITVNEDGSRFNRSQLERVIAAQKYANQMEKKFMCGTEFYTEDIANAFLAGMIEGQKRMIKQVVERDVKEDAGGYPYIDATELYDYDNDKPLAKAGDKVKVLIVKDK